MLKAFFRLQDFSSSLGLALMAGITLGGIVHLGIILALPHLAERDAYGRLSTIAGGERAELVAAPGGAAWPPDTDPASALGACAYSLEEGPVRVSIRTANLPQSLSFHVRGGGVFFALTDRAAVRGILEVTVMTQEQFDTLTAKEEETTLSQDIRIVAPGREGVALVRAFALFPSQKSEAKDIAGAMRCTLEAL